MHGKLRAKLIDDYPDIFIDIWAPEDISCDNGWYTIISDLCLGIDQYLKDNPMVELVEIEKIEQKFGLMFIRYYGGDEVIAHMVKFAEMLSWNTCEVCGDRGELHSKTGTEFTPMETLCNRHALNKFYRKIVE